jgi:hypothetical protein
VADSDGVADPERVDESERVTAKPGPFEIRGIASELHLLEM